MSVSVTDTRLVRIVNDSGQVMTMTMNDVDKSKELVLVVGGNRFTVKREDLLDGMVAMFPGDVAYSFKKEEDDDIPF